MEEQGLRLIYGKGIVHDPSRILLLLAVQVCKRLVRMLVPPPYLLLVPESSPQPLGGSHPIRIVSEE